MGNVEGNLPRRKALRLAAFDYNTPGAYFITICTHNKQKILSAIVGDDAHIVPKPYGEIVEKYIRNVPEIEQYVIMPNHIHMIIRLENGSMWASTPTTIPSNNCVGDAAHFVPQNNRVSSIVRSMKTLTTKEIGHSIWQRSYYDHVIRNQEDYNMAAKYIEENPLRWKQDKLYIKE